MAIPANQTTNIPSSNPATNTDSSIGGTPTSEGAPAKVLEGTGNNYDRDHRSTSPFGINGWKAPGNMDNHKIPPNVFLSKPPGDNKYGHSDAGTSADPKDPTKNPHNETKATKKRKNPKPQDPTNPTVAAAEAGKSILEAIKSIDPNNIADAVKKSLDSMIMLKMMSSLTSPAGIANMASGALGQALQQIAGQVGLGGVLNQLNSIMPQLSGLINSSTQSILSNAMNSMLSSTPIGALSSASVSAANSLANTISTAVASQSPETMAATAGQIGGSQLNMDPASLASKIMTMAAGDKYTYIEVVNGSTITHTVEILNTDFQKTLNTIPSLSGTEHVDIASNAVATAVPQLQSLLNTGLAAANFASFLNNFTSNIANAGMKAILGTDINGILSNVSTLLPNIAGNITGTLSSHLPKTALDLGKMKAGMQQMSKVLALGRMAFNIAKMFGSNPAELIGKLADSLASAVSGLPLGGQLSVVSADGGVKVTSQKSGEAPIQDSTNNTIPATTAVA